MSSPAGPSSAPFLLAPSSRPSSPTFEALHTTLHQNALKLDVSRQLFGSRNNCPIVPALVSARIRGAFETSPWAWSSAGRSRVESEEDEVEGLPRDEEEAREWIRRRERRRAAREVRKVDKRERERGGGKTAPQRQLTLTGSLLSTKSSHSNSLESNKAALEREEIAPLSHKLPRSTTPPSSAPPLPSNHSMRNSSPPRPKALSRSASPAARGSPVVSRVTARGGGELLAEEDAQGLSFEISYDEAEMRTLAEEKGQSWGEDEEILAEFGCTQMELAPPTQAEPAVPSPAFPILSAMSPPSNPPSSLPSQPLSALPLNGIASNPLLNSPGLPPIKALSSSRPSTWTPPPAPIALGLTLPEDKCKRLSSLVSTRDNSPGARAQCSLGASLLGDELGEISSFLRSDVDD